MSCPFLSSVPDRLRGRQLPPVDRASCALADGPVRRLAQPFPVRLLAALAMMGLVTPGMTQGAGATPGGLYALKLQYMLDMTEFVEWPAGAFPDSRAPFVLGIIGEDPFRAELDKLKNKQVKGRPLEIKRFKGALEFMGRLTPGRRQDDLVAQRNQKYAAMRSCHILFISDSEENRLGLILEPLGNAGVLTVSDAASFAEQGGIVKFLDDHGKVGLEINLQAAERAHLRISSKLLSLAKVIKAKADEPGQEK
jgi:YfiR/HmsC-like